MYYNKTKVNLGSSTLIKSLKIKLILCIGLLFSTQLVNANVELNIVGSANVGSINTGSQFTYTVDYGISSLTHQGINVVASIALPSYVILNDSISLGNSVIWDPSQVSSVNYNTATRTLNVVFVNPIPAGSTGQFQVKLKYLNGVTPNGYNPGITTTIDADNNQNSPAQGGGTGPVSSNTTNVVAQANNVPSVSKSLVAGGAIDNLSFYKINISNGGSDGSLILNSPVVRDTLPAGAVFVNATSFNGANSPTTYGISGGRTVVEWTFSSALAAGYSSFAYIGVRYMSPTFNVGSSVTNTANLSGTVAGLPIGTQINQNARGSVTHTITTPTPQASCNGGGISASTAWWLNNHVLAGTNCNWFSNGWYNSGNTELDSVQLHYAVDLAVDMNTIRVEPVYNAVDSASQAEILVWYKTNASGGYVFLGSYLSLDIYNGVAPVDHTVTLPSGQYITDVKFSIRSHGGNKLPIGGRQDMSYCGNVRTAAQGKKDGSPIVEGTTYNTSNPGDDGTLISNNSDGSYFFNGTQTSYSNCSNSEEILSARPVFYPPSKTTTNGTSFKASDNVKYRLRFYLGGNATANNIVISDTLDSKLTYEAGTSEYYNGSSWSSITPVVTTVGANTVLTYTIASATPEKDLYIRFEAQVKPGTAPGTIKNRFNLSSTTANVLFTGLTDYKDVSVISAVALKVRKGQNSNCSPDPNTYVYFPTIASALPGGNVKYKITITNQGNVVAKDFVLIDPFPFIGDYRGSQWFANMAAPATVSDPLSTVYYTTTTNPCSNDLTPAINPSGCNNPVWTITPPIDLTTIRGIKLVRSADLPVFDSIEISWNMKAPVGVPFGHIMNNSVNYQVTRADNNAQLLPATPNQVGMKADCVNPIGSLGNYVWIDDNKNGLQDEPASKGLNGVRVYLYGPGVDSTIGGLDDVLLDSTITANDFSGNPGYYLFPFLNSGKYYVKFPTTTLNNTYRLTPTNNQATQTDGNNDAATATGNSGLVTIKEDGTGVNKDNLTIDAGYFPIGSLGNYVWIDANRDGLQNEPSSNGVNGVKVYLYTETSPGNYTKTDSTTTANDINGNPGYYNFVILENGNYKVQFPTEVGSNGLTTQNGTAQTNGNSDASIADGFSPVIVMNLPLNGLHRNNPTIDAGYVPFGSLGNYVWFDENLDGLQNEPASNGLNGAPVYLYKETSPGVYTKIDSTTTANDGSGNPGYYNFVIKATGNYKVQFPDKFQNRPLTIQNSAAGVNGNSDPLVGNGFTNAIAMNLNGTGVQVNNPTIDAGYICNLNAGSNQVVCAGFGVTLTGTSPTTGNWVAHSANATGATLSTTTGGIATANFASTTSGIYKFVYVDGACKDTMEVLVNPKPNAGVDKFIECGSNILSTTITATPTGGTWTALGSNPSGTSLGTTTAGSATVSLPTAPTQGIWQFVYTAPTGCTDTMKITIAVTGHPAPDVNMGSNPICRNGFVQLCPTVWGWSNYQWYKNGVAIAAPIGTASCITLDSSQIGTYTLAATNGAGCWSAQSSPIVVVFDSTCNHNSGGVSGGGGGGIESKSLGNVISQRLFGNAINNKKQEQDRTNTLYVKSTTVLQNGPSDLTLNDITPQIVQGAEKSFISSPTDLVNFTNAVEVLSVDYTSKNVTTAVAFATKTLGSVYTHTKPICDRLRGAELLETKIVDVSGYNLMAFKVRTRTGQIEYAINLSAGVAKNRNTISLQSNWFTDNYQQDEILFNYQLWAVSYNMARNLAYNVITKLRTVALVMPSTTTDLPTAYVSKGNRNGTQLQLTIQNNTSNTNGYFELKEKQTETSAEVTRQVSFTAKANGTSTLSVPVNDNYEASLYLYLNGKLVDLMYLSDGSWSIDYDKAKTTINTFTVTNETGLSLNNTEYKLFRNVQVQGSTRDYVTMYKTLNGGGTEQNLSDYKGIIFNANPIGVNEVKITIIKKSIQNWADQYSFTMPLDGNKEYAVGMSQFKSSKFSTALNMNDVLAVNFSFSNTRGSNNILNASLSKARFTKEDVAYNQLLVSKAISIYPNPSNGVFITNFMSDVDQSLVVKIVSLATGQIIKTQFVQAKKGANNFTINLDKTVANGMYSLVIEGDNGKYQSQKIMLNK